MRLREFIIAVRSSPAAEAKVGAKGLLIDQNGESTRNGPVQTDAYLKKRFRISPLYRGLLGEDFAE